MFYNSLMHFHRGFRRNRSCITNMLESLNNILRPWIGWGRWCRCSFLDFSKAFDNVNTRITGPMTYRELPSIMYPSSCIHQLTDQLTAYSQSLSYSFVCSKAWTHHHLVSSNYTLPTVHFPGYSPLPAISHSLTFASTPPIATLCMHSTKH